MAHKLESQIKVLQGKTIAIVYMFENEDAPGLGHYWIWKSDIISRWMNATQEIGCLPFILDIRTFIQKASFKTLPQIDYVVNLNCGCRELSTLSLVPSVCSFLAIPCIPCNSVAIVMSENKLISNLLAVAKGINVPMTLDTTDENGIFRPLSLGSSIGVRKGYCEDVNEGTYQEFIPGYDITIPIVYNPIIDDIDILPPLLYLPKSKNPNWFYGEEEKAKEDGYTLHHFTTVENNLKEKIIDFARIFPIRTFGRIDARLKFEGSELSCDVVNRSLGISDLFFIEINSMPTIEYGDFAQFETAFNAVLSLENYTVFNCVNAYINTISKPTIHGFLLTCSMIALSKAKY